MKKSVSSPQQSKRSKAFPKKLVLFVGLIVLASIFSIEKLRELAAKPVGDKDCPPINPELAVPTSKNELKMNDPFGTLEWFQKGGYINDASCLNKTAIYGIVQVRDVEDIKQALTFAKENNLKVSMAGVKHSMGGHAFYKNNVVLDMSQFNKKSLNEETKVLTVQSGATWHDIQEFLHPKYAVKAMQSSDIFSVGGSISVNAHGMDHRAGSVGNTIKSMNVMLADGSIKKLSATENAELYNLVLGGYGLFGVILDVELDITTNDVYDYHHEVISYKDFPKLFEEDINKDENLGLFYGHLSTAPSNFLDEMILYKYQKAEGFEGDIPPLAEVGSVQLRRLVLNLSKKGWLARELKWFAEKKLEPLMASCLVNRNQAMGEGEACFVARNEPMHDSVPYLRNNLKNDTDILHEYFIPRDQFITFVDGMREIMKKHNTNLLNASVRVVHKENNTLNYAPQEAFAIVLYINQSTDQKGNDQMKQLTSELIDLTAQVNGRFFLPYQLHYTETQLTRSYPEVGGFFEAKKQYDPTGMFTNTFYERYSPLIEKAS